MHPRHCAPSEHCTDVNECVDRRTDYDNSRVISPGFCLLSRLHGDKPQMVSSPTFSDARRKEDKIRVKSSRQIKQGKKKNLPRRSIEMIIR